MSEYSKDESWTATHHRLALSFKLEDEGIRLRNLLDAAYIQGINAHRSDTEERKVKALEVIASCVKDGVLQMRDVDRAKVYGEHLGEKLRT